MDSGLQLTAEGAKTKRWALAAAAAILAVAAAALFVLERGVGGPAVASGSTPADTSASRGPATGGASLPPIPPAGQAGAQPGQGIVVRPSPPPVATDVRARVQEQATAAMARVREAVLATCKPQVAALDRPAVFTVQLSFDPSGREVGRGATPDGPMPEGLETCVLVAEAGAVHVDAPGAPMSAFVRLEIP